MGRARYEARPPRRDQVPARASRDVAERFLIEARATAQCNHENIVIIYEVDELEGMPYMVLEFLEGKTLRDIMGPIGVGERDAARRASSS